MFKRDIRIRGIFDKRRRIGEGCCSLGGWCFEGKESWVIGC